MVNKTLFSLVFILLSSGCSLIPADKINNKAAESVHVSTENANKNCNYVGEVYGNQGNLFTGLFTSNINVINGAINNLKNQAEENHANFVYLEKSEATNNSILHAITISYVHPFYLFGGVFNVSLIGQAYSCQDQNMTGDKREK